MKILVTGGAGFIGSNLIEKLLESKNNKISCIDNFDDFYDPEFKRENVSEFLKNENFVLYKNDIRDKEELKKIFEKEKPDFVIHLAAKADTRLSVSDPEEYLSVNIMGTLNLLELSKDSGINKFVFISSSSVYGNQNTPPFSEDGDTNRMISPYGASKKMGEMLCYTYHHNFDMEIVCLRVFNAYGERMRPQLVLYKWMNKILKDEEIEISGDGSRMRDFTYVGDTVDAIIKSMNSDIKYDVLNIGNSNPISLRDLLKVLEKVIGKKANIKSRPSNKASVELTHANCHKAGQKLGWKPVVSLEEGINKLFIWFRDNRFKDIK